MKGIFAIPVFLVSILVSIHTFAQNRSFAGYYITPDGQKLSGVFTDYQQWEKNPSEVHFVPSASASAITLTPLNCRMFSVDSYDEYLAYTGKRLVNSIGDAQKVIKENATSSNDIVEDVSVFLRLLKRTDAAELYGLKDAKRANYFIKTTGGSLVELRNKESYEQGEIKEFPEYRQHLQGLFAKRITDKKLGQALEDLPYTEEALVNFLNRLFPSKQETVKTNSEANGWIIAGGVSLNFLKVDGDNRSIEVGQKFNTSVSPLLSVGYMVVSKRRFGKEFLYPQLKIFRHQNTADFTSNGTRTVIRYQSDLILLPEFNGGVNIVNKENLRFHLTLGIGLATLLNNLHTRSRYAASGGEPYFVSEDKLAKVGGVSANAAAGVMINKKIIIVASYQVPSTVGHIDQYSPVSSGVQVRVGYKL